MRLDELRVLACIRCGATNRPLRKLKDALWPNARACDVCSARYAVEDLVRDAEVTLAGAAPVRPHKGRGGCAHCGEPVLALPTGGYPLWCSQCERDRQRLMGGA
jgi:hypothetical protein